MTLKEFRAWFDGFVENIDDQPTQKQWARIKERVAEIDNTVVTERVYVDRYLPTPWRRRYWGNDWDYLRWVGGATERATYSVSSSTSASPRKPFESLPAMRALGKLDAETVA